MEIAGYVLIGRVAATHASTIWKAHDPRLDRFVALKELAPGVDPGLLAREASILAGLDHPHIVRVYDLVTAADRRYLVEDWLEGASLGAVRDHSQRFTPAQALGVLRGALQGLAYAHGRGVVHGDISPGNILIDVQGTSKLIDFGAAGQPEPAGPGPRSGLSTSRGTAGYRAPEVAAGEPAGKRADVYAAAAVLADLLTDHRPSLAGPPSLDGIPGPVAEVLARALSADPAARQPDAATLLAELEPAADRALGAWLPLAGTSGLVSATLGAGGVALVAAEASTGGAAAAAAAGGIAPVAGAVPRVARRWVLAGGAGAAVAAVVVAAILLTRPSGSTSGAANVATTTSSTASSAAPATSPVPVTTTSAPAAVVTTSSSSTPSTTSSTPTTPTTTSRTTATTTSPKPAPVGFAGTYKVVVLVTKYLYWVDHKYTVGQKLDRTWKVTSACTAKGCTSTVKSSTGSSFKVTLTKGTYTATEKIENDCFDQDGNKMAEKAAATTTFSLTPTTVNGVVVSLKGTFVEHQLAKCTNQETPLAIWEQTYAVTRVGA